MLHDFIHHLRWERRRSDATVRAYETDVAQWFLFAEYALGMPEAEGCARTHVRAWVTSLVEQGTSARSVNRKLSALRSFYAWAASAGIRTDNPAEGIPLLRASQRVVRALTKDEVHALLDSELLPDDEIGRRDRFLLLTLYATGLRRSELIQLTYDQIAASRIRVRGKGNKEREIPVLPEWEEALKAHRVVWEPRSSRVFCRPNGRPLLPGVVYTVVKSYLQRASTADQLGPHALRHTFATHLLDMGAELTVIRELLGHANLSATQVYTHASVEQLKSVYQRAHPRGR